MNTKQISDILSENIATYKSVLYGFVLGIFFPLSAGFYFFMIKDIPFNISEIKCIIFSFFKLAHNSIYSVMHYISVCVSLI